jgi:uncharacterized protein YbbC (DUF1343 family)
MQRTHVGIELLRDSGWADVAGVRSAALVHAASVLPDTLQHTVDALASAGPTVNLQAIFAPEHGFRGDRQAEHGDPAPYVDKDTGIMVHSVYRKNETELQALLVKLNLRLVLVDIQDAGTRLYTFIWTLFSLMRAAGGLRDPPRFVIADRPNPLGGLAVEGPVLNVSCCSSRYGLAPVTHRHGLTVGESARLFAALLASDGGAPPVHVVAMRNWSRSFLFRDTGLPWIPPSPNLPTADVAFAYTSTVFVEATTASEGRGTTLPFETIGAPWLNASQLLDAIKQPGRASAQAQQQQWRKAYFIPTFFKYNGSACAGAQLVRPRTFGAQSFREGVRLLCALRQLGGQHNFRWDGSWFGQPGSILIDRYAGTPRLRELIDAGLSADDVADAFQAETDAFAKERVKYWLYQ